VVFTLRMAYQASNNTRNSGVDSLYSEICTFAADISRERNAIASRAQAEAARKRQQHRQELQEARDYAAAQTLKSFKDAGSKVRPFILFRPVYLISLIRLNLFRPRAKASSALSVPTQMMRSTLMMSVKPDRRLPPYLGRRPP
jgi:hypothetical protein